MIIILFYLLPVLHHLKFLLVFYYEFEPLLCVQVHPRGQTLPITGTLLDIPSLIQAGNHPFRSDIVIILYSFLF